MRIGYGGIALEANTFSPFSATESLFEAKILAEGAALADRVEGSSTALGGAVAGIRAAGCEPVPLFAANGAAGGVMPDALFARFLDLLQASIAAAGRLDGIVLALHGALVTESSDDGEADQLFALRRQVGALPIGISLDTHANCTPRMLALANAIVGYKLYPHTDSAQAGAQAARIIAAQACGQVRPVMAMRTARMKVQAAKGTTTPGLPMSDLLDAARAAERKAGVLAASYFAAFSKFDGPDIGFRGVVVTDGDHALADHHARRLAEIGWDRRHRFDVLLVPVEQAIREGLHAPPGPVVLVDSGDCVGGGAAGDSVVVLRALLDLARDAPSCVIVTAPEVAGEAHRRGEGAVLDVALGSHFTRSLYGDALKLQARVERIGDGSFTFATVNASLRHSMGPSAVLRVGEARVLVCSLPTYEVGGDQFRAMGIEPEAMRFVVSKTVGNAATGFPGAVRIVWVDTPGPQSQNPHALPWKRLSRPLWPWDDNFPNPIV